LPTADAVRRAGGPWRPGGGGGCRPRGPCASPGATAGDLSRPLARSSSVQKRHEPPGTSTIGGVRVAEVGFEQGLLGAYARDEDRNEGGRQQDADSATEDQDPPSSADDQGGVEGVADPAIRAGRHEIVFLLNGDEDAVATPEYENRPEANRSTEEGQD